MKKLYRVEAFNEYGSRIETITEDPTQFLKELGTGYTVLVEPYDENLEEKLFSEIKDAHISEDDEFITLPVGKSRMVH